MSDQRADHERACSFCAKGTEQVQRILFGPPPMGDPERPGPPIVSICNECVKAGERIMFDNDDAIEVAATCSFCRKTRPEIQALIGSDVSDHHICNACMQVMSEIVAESRGEGAAPLPHARLREPPWRRWLRRVF